ncbi:MAG: hypothetical protein ACTSW1_05980 [Candidatus Hodarchaeales archaeon]
MLCKLLRIKKPSKSLIIKLIPLVISIVLLGIQVITGTAPPNSPPPPGFT